MTYVAFGRVVASDIELPELPRAADRGPAQLTIRRRARIDLPPDLRWTAVWEAAADAPGVWHARHGGDLFLAYDGLARLRVRGGVVDVEAAAEPETLRHALLDQLLPLAIAASGEIVLHASAVEADDGAVVFAGEAGSGKSTLAAALAAAGANVIADDAVLLDVRNDDAWAVPSYPGLRLWPDAAERFGAIGYDVAAVAARSSKRRLVPAGAAVPVARPVAAVYVLRREPSVAGFEHLSRRDAVVELVRHAFTPDTATRDGRRTQIDRAARAAARLDVWALAIDRDLDGVDARAQRVLAHARGRASARLQGP